MVLYGSRFLVIFFNNGNCGQAWINGMNTDILGVMQFFCNVCFSVIVTVYFAIILRFIQVHLNSY